MALFANVKRIILFLILLCLFCGRGYFQALSQTEDSTGLAFAEQKKIIDASLDNITVEIAKQYVISKAKGKETNFPEAIRTITKLEGFLNKIYPDKKHELRQAVINLQQYKERFTASNAVDVKKFLRNGIKQYAVRLDGKPFDFEKRKIETIINEADSKVKELLSENKKFNEPIENKDSDRIFILLFNFIKGNSLLIVGILTLVILLLIILILLSLRRAKGNKIGPFVYTSYNQKKIPSKKTPNKIKTINHRNSTFSQKSTKENKPQFFIEETDQIPLTSANGAVRSNWLVVKTSVAGKSHLESNPPIPCQDSHYYKSIGKDWGIAVVCDGAGSKEYSHYGSRFVAKQTGLIFEDIIKQNHWQITNILPTQGKWHEVSKRAFAKIRIDLEEFAKKYEVESGLLSCTIIVVIHSPIGILASHIGDGRAAFCNVENEWKAIIKPYKGDEANQTVFITSVDWNEQDKFIESTIFEEKPIAFVLMSDGCEAHSFEVNIYDKEEQKYKDPNKPYPKFFQPIVTTLKGFYQSQIAIEEINTKWKRFIESGNEKLKNEPDDKTMILGVFVEQEEP